MLGTPDDADDVVQDAWLRWQSVDRSTITEPAAWLTTVTTRLAIDRLRSARRRREVYVGPWLPEPLPAGDDQPFSSIAAAESLTLAFLTVLERLEPVERAVFLLHDVFGYPFAEVATYVERSEPAARQIAKRARDRVQAERPRVDADPEHAEELAAAFLGAVVEGDVEVLRRLLTDDVVHLSDGGPHRRAARRPVVGSDRVARLLIKPGIPDAARHAGRSGAGQRPARLVHHGRGPPRAGAGPVVPGRPGRQRPRRPEPGQARPLPRRLAGPAVAAMGDVRQRIVGPHHFRAPLPGTAKGCRSRSWRRRPPRRAGTVRDGFPRAP